ncbi:MAG TPA: hypothetical protein VGX70_10405 [Gemmataceae bacterium]|jgi:hypothetical protein|nr:hypothetical protein [Gemmataceae bacterium]
MAQFLRLQTTWINVDKIVRVENGGTPTAPVIYFTEGDPIDFTGDDAKSLEKYLNGSQPILKK